MPRWLHYVVVPLPAILLAALMLPLTAAGRQSPSSDTQVIADFVERVNAYVALHKKLEDAAPKLPEEATPQQIDQAQRTLAADIRSARAGAKRGDLFTPRMVAFIKRLIDHEFRGPEGRQLLSSIMDENVKALVLNVNQRYPDAIPLTTMPPEILKALPELPEELEYRFVADQLVLLDPHAHIILDFIPEVLPRR